jgi:hypothetical protein
VTAANFEPNFQFIPDTTSVQQSNTVYFSAKANEEVTINASGVLWNYGNPTQSYIKTVKFYLFNTSVFYIAPEFETQTVTIPSATSVGDQGQIGVCEVGESCVNVTFPITKYNLTEKGITSNTDIYGAIVSITGLDLNTFTLDLRAPTIRITLENTQRNSWGNWGWGRNRQSCYSYPNWNNNNQAYNTITFDGNPSCADTKTITFDIWNLLNVQNNATIEISGLNTTAFTLYTTPNNNRWNIYDNNPQYVDLTVPQPSTGRWSRWIRNLNYCRFPTTQGCNTVTWGISRNALIDSNGNSIGIEAGNYPVTIKDTQTGVQITVDLIISPYIQRVHVSDLTGTYSKKDRTIDFIVTVENDAGQTVSRVPIIASYTYPNGNSGKTKTSNEYAWTGRNGQATFSDWNPKKGTYTFTVTDLSAPTSNRWSRFFSSVIYIYDSASNNPNPPSVTVKVT